MGKRFAENPLNRSILIGMLGIAINLWTHDSYAERGSSVHSLPNYALKHKKAQKENVSIVRKKSYTLQDAIEDVLASNPNIQADMSARREATHRIGQAESGFLPRIDLKAATGYDRIHDNYQGNALSGPVSGTVSTWKHREASINVSQDLFSGFDTVNKIDKANKEVNQAGFKVEETQHLLAFEVVRAFVTIRRLQRLVKLAQKNVHHHETILDKVNNLVNSGKNTVGDSQHVQSRLSDARASLQDIQGDYDSAVARFIELTGHEPITLSSARVPEHYLPKSLETALAEARKRNHSLKIANATIDVAKADLALTNSPFYPSVSLEGEARRNHNAFGETGKQTTITALLVARYNLFSGFQNVEKKREYIDRVTTARYRRDSEWRRVEREIRTSWAEMRSARQQATSLEAAVATKHQVRDTYLGQFDMGSSSFIDILNATHEWFLAQGSKITADATQDISSLKLLTSMGKLIDCYVSGMKASTKSHLKGKTDCEKNWKPIRPHS